MDVSKIRRMVSQWSWRGSKKTSTVQSATTERYGRGKEPSEIAHSNEPGPDDFPIFPPPSPRLILQNRSKFWNSVRSRKYGAPRGVLEDTPLYALYRFYEFIVVDEVRPYRNTLEAFWRKKDWAVEDIPDPEDEDPERYAFLAACTYLIMRAFNERVKLGLARHMPSILLPEEAEELRNTPHHLRRYEKVPSWAARVPPLEKTLSVPAQDGVTLNGSEDERADQDFLAKNILIWTPHIHFT